MAFFVQEVVAVTIVTVLRWYGNVWLVVSCSVLSLIVSSAGDSLVRALGGLLLPHGNGKTTRELARFAGEKKGGLRQQHRKHYPYKDRGH